MIIIYVCTYYDIPLIMHRVWFTKEDHLILKHCTVYITHESNVIPYSRG